MTNLRVVVLAPFADPIRERLTIPVDMVPVPGESSPEMAAAIGDADVLVNGAFLAEWAGRAPRLRLLQALGAGYDGFALDAVPAGCLVANVYGHDYGIAEYVFMTMSALNRELFQADADLRRGVWRGGPLRELRGRSLLVVGLGQIGREVARWGNFVGMRVSAVTEHPSEARREASGLVALGAISELPTFAAEADFVVIAVPHSATTANLVDEHMLASMRPAAYLINVGRGPVVDQWALHSALRDGRLAGAAIDVWYHYPEGDEPAQPSDAPFHELPNVILTPHTAGYTEGTMRHRFEAIAENIRRVAAGERPMNVVWPRA